MSGKNKRVFVPEGRGEVDRSRSPLGDFNQFLRFIQLVKKNIKSGQFTRDDSLTLGPGKPIPEGYLTVLLKYWIDQGAIPINDVPGSPPWVTEHFYKRILTTIAYSLQHPTLELTVDMSDKNSARLALGRLIDSYVQLAGGDPKVVPFRAFCVVIVNDEDIPNHYGHSAYLSNSNPRYTAPEQVLERTYRRALAFPYLNGACPEGHEDWPGDQCAEYIAYPYVLDFVKAHLGTGSGKTLVVKSLTQSVFKIKKAFCSNCEGYVKDLVNQNLGLRIIDLANGWIYESQETSQLFAANKKVAKDSGDC